MARSFVHAALVLFFFATGDRATASEAEPGVTRMPVYIGTYTGGKSKGIYLLELDLKTGALTAKGVTEGVVNPSFLAFHPHWPFLYAVNSIEKYDGKPGGSVSAFAIDPVSGALTFLNRKPSGGAGPCHLTVDRTGRAVLVANYSAGTVSALRIEEGGRLGDTTAVIQHTGSSVNPKRQEGPHAHSVNLDAGNRFAVVADLGLDRLLVYRFDAKTCGLQPNDPPFTVMKPGAGPRHFTFHPDGRHAYAINELDSTVTALDYDAARGTLSPIQTLPTLPEGFNGANSTAEVLVAPSGRSLYGSNRGHNSIVVFAIDSTTGRLTLVEHEPTGGTWPRNFGIDPTGSFLLAANRDSDSIVSFRIDQKTGALTPTGNSAAVPTPVCVRFPPRYVPGARAE